jgi:hypothetical protein
MTVTMNIAFFTWENVYWLSQLLLVAFAGLALISGRIVNNRQAAQLLTLQTELATAQGKQAEAEKSLLELRQKLAPRLLKGESQDAVVKATEPFAPQQFDILWYSDDPESHNLANDIYAAFQRAKWVLDRPSGSWLGFSVVLGVIIEFNPSEKDAVAPACEALVSALQKEGIAATAQPWMGDDKEHQPKTLKIKVGKKP